MLNDIYVTVCALDSHSRDEVNPSNKNSRTFKPLSYKNLGEVIHKADLTDDRAIPSLPG